MFQDEETARVYQVQLNHKVLSVVFPTRVCPYYRRLPIV